MSLHNPVQEPPRVPYTLQEAQSLPLSADKLSKINLFTPIIHRRKHSLHYLLELFILHVILLPPTSPSAKQWTEHLLSYLSRASPYLIPEISGKPLTERILGIITAYAPALSLTQIPESYLTSLIAPPDEPAKAAIFAFAAFLHRYDAPNGWLLKYLTPAHGNRSPLPPAFNHCLYCPPFLDSRGHLVWYTVRTVHDSILHGCRTWVSAHGAIVALRSGSFPGSAIQMHRREIVNYKRFDIRLWETWTGGAAGIGKFASLGRGGLGRPISFDRPVVFEDALAVGWTVKNGILRDPNGTPRSVRRGKDGLYRVIRGKGEEVDWQPGMRFA